MKLLSLRLDVLVGSYLSEFVCWFFFLHDKIENIHKVLDVVCFQLH